jgi:putative phosphoesterase
MTRRAVALFRERNVNLVVHAGDIGSSEIIELFEGLNARFVLGNCDTDHEKITQSCISVGIEPASRCSSFGLEGKKFFVCHGDDCSRYHEAVTSGNYDYLIIGHTHEFRAAHKGNTLVINPGAVTRDDHSDVMQTVAILDVDTGHVEKIFLTAEDHVPTLTPEN